MPRHARGFDTDAAWDHLVRRDRRLGAWMKRIGRIEAEPGLRLVGADGRVSPLAARAFDHFA